MAIEGAEKMVVVVEEGDVFQGPFPLIYILVLTLSYKAVPICFHRKIKFFYYKFFNNQKSKLKTLF